jgi:hypothetical protein
MGKNFNWTLGNGRCCVSKRAIIALCRRGTTANTGSKFLCAGVRSHLSTPRKRSDAEIYATIGILDPPAN